MNCGMATMTVFYRSEAAMGYISAGMGDHFSALLVSLMALQFMLVDQNPFRPC